MSFLLGLVGGGGGGIGRIIGQVIRQIGKFIRYVATKIWHVIKTVLHYLRVYAKAYYAYLGKLYDTFQRDPIRFTQFAGSLAILVYYGLM